MLSPSGSRNDLFGGGKCGNRQTMVAESRNTQRRILPGGTKYEIILAGRLSLGSHPCVTAVTFMCCCLEHAGKDQLENSLC
eukprot:5949709-Amphidinium_carterae.1